MHHQGRAVHRSARIRPGRDGGEAVSVNNSSSGRLTYLLVLPWEPRYVGGVTNVVLNLARSMAEKGSFAPNLAVDSWSDTTPRAADECIYFRFSLLGSIGVLGLFKGFVTAPMRLWRTAQLLRACNAGVVNFHYPGHSPVGVALLKILGLYRGRLLLSYHG